MALASSPPAARSICNGSPGGLPCAGYLDADSNLDLVVADTDLNQIDVLPGNKNGAFRVGSTYAVSGRPRRVAIADLNAMARPT